MGNFSTTNSGVINEKTNFYHLFLHFLIWKSIF